MLRNLVKSGNCVNVQEVGKVDDAKELGDMDHVERVWYVCLLRGSR